MDSSGTLKEANIVPFELLPAIAIIDTLPATSVDNPAGSAQLTGYLAYAPGSVVTYFYEYSPSCNPSGPFNRTEDQTLVATGSQDLTGPAKVSGLPSGTYCYRVVATDGTSTQQGQWEPFKISGVYNMAITEPTIIIPAANNCVILRGTTYVPPGYQVAYYYDYGVGLNISTYQTVASTPLHTSVGDEVAQAIQVCGLPNGDYNYYVRAVVSPGTPQEYTLYGNLQPFKLSNQVSCVKLWMIVRGFMAAHFAFLLWNSLGTLRVWQWAWVWGWESGWARVWV